jgi:hypothetical protein
LRVQATLLLHQDLRLSNFLQLGCNTQQQMSLAFAQLVMFLEMLNVLVAQGRSTSVVTVELLNLNQS